MLASGPTRIGIAVLADESATLAAAFTRAFFEVVDLRACRRPAGRWGFRFTRRRLLIRLLTLFVTHRAHGTPHHARMFKNPADAAAEFDRYGYGIAVVVRRS
jgi:hypothetical protein